MGNKRESEEQMKKRLIGLVCGSLFVACGVLLSGCDPAGDTGDSGTTVEVTGDGNRVLVAGGDAASGDTITVTTNSAGSETNGE